jgi:hypothetical protein
MAFQVRSFQGSAFDGDEAFYADFPAFREWPRRVVRFNLAKKTNAAGPKIEDPYARQYGLYLVAGTPQHTGKFQAMLNPCHWKYPDFDPFDCDVTYQVQDLRSWRVLWSRHFAKEVPGFQVEPEQARVVLHWAASDAAVADEIKSHTELAEAWSAARNHPGASFLEILNLSDGSVRRAMLLDSGAVAGTAGERLLVSHRGYMEVFSLASGAKEGEISGRLRAISPSGSLLSVGGDSPNELEIYDLGSRTRLDGFAFPSRIEFEQFSADGKRFLVLTSDQTAYFLNMTSLAPAGSTRP